LQESPENKPKIPDGYGESPAGTTPPTTEPPVKVKLSDFTAPDLSNKQLQVGDWGRIGTVEVVQVIGDSTLLVSRGDDMMLLSDVSTSNMIDGRSYSWEDAFKVRGTQQYVTVLGGTNTVLVASPMSRNEKLEILQRAAENAAADERRRLAEEARQEIAKWRTWTSKDGQYTTHAKFMRFERSRVYLQKEDGTEFDLSLYQLCDDDQEFIRQQLKTP